MPNPTYRGQTATSPAAPSSNGGMANAIPLTQKGAPNGVPVLDATAKIPVSQMRMAEETRERLEENDVTVAALTSDVAAKQVAGNYATGGGTATGSNSGDQFTAMTASRFLGRVTAGFGPAEQLTGTQATAFLDLATAAFKGLLSPAQFTKLASLSGTNTGDQDLSGLATTAALASGLATKQAAGSYLVASDLTWAGITGKPTTFPPSAHTHVIADVTGLQSALDAKQVSGDYATNTALATGLAGKQASGSYAAASHNHVIGDVTGLQTALDAKQALNNVGYAAGAGGAVAQATSRTTAVTIAKLTGAITLFSKATTANLIDSFTVTNSTVLVGDTINVSVRATGIYFVFVTNVAAGSFRVTVFTPTAQAAEAPVINFAVVRGQAA